MAAKTIVELALRFVFVAQLNQSALEQFAALVTVLARPFQKRVPFIRRVTDLPIFRDRRIDPALFQIITGSLGRFFLQQIVMKPFRRFGVQLQEIAPGFMLAVFIRADGALFHHRNSDARAELAHRGRKIDVLVIHDEAEDAASHATAEAVKRLALRADRK